MAKREKTVTRSFRLSESAIDALQKEAEKRNITANTLLNDLLLTFSEHDRFLNEFHIIKLSSSTFRRILQATSEETVREAGRLAGTNIPSSFVLAKFGDVNEQNAIEYLKTMSGYAGLFVFNFVDRPGSRTLTLIHSLGPKGSVFLSEYAKAALEKAGTKTRVSFGDDSVTLNLLERKGPEM